MFGKLLCMRLCWQNRKKTETFVAAFIVVINKWNLNKKLGYLLLSCFHDLKTYCWEWRNCLCGQSLWVMRFQKKGKYTNPPVWRPWCLIPSPSWAHTTFIWKTFGHFWGDFKVRHPLVHSWPLVGGQIHDWLRHNISSEPYGRDDWWTGTLTTQKVRCIPLKGKCIHSLGPMFS